MPELPCLAPSPGESLAPIPQALLALAPLRLRNYRTVRYIGDDRCIQLTDLAKHDRSLLRNFYDLLTELLFLLTNPSADDARRWADVTAWIVRHDLNQLIADVRALGAASHRQRTSEELSKAMHDVRGGAFSALLGRLQLLSYLPRDEAGLQTLFVLARDHHKIMRSAVTGLDDQRRDEDHLPKSHDVRLVVDKWHKAVGGPKWHERPIQMFIDCRHQGALTECCLESAALDRIFYNLSNNACRHCAGSRLEMAIFPVPQAGGDCLRFVLSNPVDEPDATYLRRAAPRGGDHPPGEGGLNLESLFTPETSSTGSGYGLTVVADFVTGAFGLRDRQQALQERYVGAVFDAGVFRTWFHWPRADDDLEQKLDDYHRPEQSFTVSYP